MSEDAESPAIPPEPPVPVFPSINSAPRGAAASENPLAHVERAAAAVSEHSRTMKLVIRLRQEVPNALNHAPVLFWSALIFIVFLLWQFWGYHTEIKDLKYDKKQLAENNGSLSRSVESNSSSAQNLRDDNQRLNTRVQEKDAEIASLTQQKNNAERAKDESEHSLAQWIMLANSNTTNTPLTVHMDAINSALEATAKSFNKVVDSIASRTPRLSLYCNGVLADNAPTVELGSDRGIFLQITNIGSAVVEKGTLLCIFNLDRTNLVFDARWQESHVYLLDQTPTFGITISTSEPLFGGSRFDATRFYISTNVPPGFYGFQVNISASGAERYLKTLGLKIN